MHPMLTLLILYATSVISEGVVRITIQPALARFGRGDHGMPACLRVPGGVAVDRIVAAQCRAAGLTGAQMDPTVASLDTLLTLMAFCLFDGRNGFEMLTG